MEDIGKSVRDYFTKKLGNPIMPSKEKQQIKDLELQDNQEKEIKDKQEKGEDYPSTIHTSRRAYRG